MAGFADNMMGFAFLGRGPFTRVLEFLEFVLGNRFLDQCDHTGQKWNAQVHLRKTEKPPVRPHEPKIKGATHDGAPGKGMAGNGANGGYGIEKEPSEKPIHGIKKGLCRFNIPLLNMGDQPIQINSV